MTDRCKYRFLVYIKKTSLSSKRFNESMIETTILANLRPKLSGRGSEELPIKRVRKTVFVCSFCFNLHNANHFYPCNITSIP